MIITDCALSSIIAASSSVYLTTLRFSPPVSSDWLPPVSPKKILARERFIALHIILVSIKPEAPTNAPHIMRILLLRTKPVAAAATPEQEFSKEMTLGISAPAIGITKKIQ